MEMGFLSQAAFYVYGTFIQVHNASRAIRFSISRKYAKGLESMRSLSEVDRQMAAGREILGRYQEQLESMTDEQIDRVESLATTAYFEALLSKMPSAEFFSICCVIYLIGMEDGKRNK